MSNVKRQCNTCVLVLGDFGRSPRMQYHTLSLVNSNYRVNVVAFKGSEPIPELRENENVDYFYMKNTPCFEKYVPRFLAYILKSLWQSVILFWTLMKVSNLDHILVQNPPSIPTLPIAYVCCLLKNSNLIVDFHNYGYTILSLALSEKHVMVKIYKWCEKVFSRKAKYSLCVTKAMKEDLKSKWNIESIVFYDCAPEIFHPISLEEKHNFILRLSQNHEQFQSDCPPDCEDECTKFTKKVGDVCELDSHRPAFIISSTSWTEDEDFSVLLSALEDYERAVKKSKLPNLLVAITGKGPLKEYYEKEIVNKGFVHVEILTLWLKAEDYPTLLACADLGVCLHKSSSGLDLPMKVVDMFGAGLPVCAIEFDSIGELVKHNKNGLVFQDSTQLSKQIQRLFRGFPRSKSKLSIYRENIQKSDNLRWDENWKNIVLPAFQKLEQHSS